MVKVSFKLTVSDLLQVIQAKMVLPELPAESFLRKEIKSLGEPKELDSSGVCFLIQESFLKEILETKAEVVVVQKNLIEKIKAQKDFLIPTRTIIECDDAYLGLAKLSEKIAQNDSWSDWKVDLTSSHDKVKIHASAKVSPLAYLSEGVEVGENTQIHSGVHIGPGVKIGRDCTIFPGVVLYPRVEVADRVRIHSNCVIGADGFGYARSPKGSVKIWHLGKVKIGSDVEIGAGTTIDKGTIKDTIVESGTKIDNQVQIGHNGYIGAHSILCAQVGLAGNVTLGKGVILAGKAGIADKLSVGDGALVGPMSGLSKDVAAGEQVMGQQPAKPRREWWKLLAYFDRLPELFQRVKAIEGKIGSSKSNE